MKLRLPTSHVTSPKSFATSPKSCAVKLKSPKCSITSPKSFAASPKSCAMKSFKSCATSPQSFATSAKSCAMKSSMRSGLQQRRRLLKGGPLHLDCKAAAAEQMPKEVHVRLADQYDILEKLGQGSAGVLHHAKRRADGKEVALKTIPKIDPEFTAFTQKEYNVLRSIKHPHIIQAFDFFETEEQIVLVLELFGGQSLEDTVHCASRRCLDEGVTKGLFKMLLQAIDHLHQHRIVHRDVKAANILV